MIQLTMLKKMFLTIIFSLSSNLCFSSEITAEKASFFKEITTSDYLVSWDLGLSANAMLSDLSSPLMGLGMGQQTSLSVNFARKNPRGLKLIFQSVLSRQSNFRNTKIDSTANLRRLEQSWKMFGIGIENRKSNRLIDWYWDGILGYAFGENSKLQNQVDGIDSPLVTLKEPTRSFLYVSLGAGIRKKINEVWGWTAGFRTHLVLGSVYGDRLKSKTLVLIPLQANLGIEYSF